MNERPRTTRPIDLLEATALGLAGGLAATWIMTQLQNLLSAKSDEKDNEQEARHSQEHEQEKPESPTVLVADQLSRLVRGRRVSDAHRQTAGQIVHYGYGTLMGGVYGLITGMMPELARGRGLAWGTVLWLGGDEVAVPLLKLSPPPQEHPVSVHASALGAHLVYGVSLYAILRGLRALSDRAAMRSATRARPSHAPPPQRQPRFDYADFIATGA